jgi:hypothetical protein
MAVTFFSNKLSANASTISGHIQSHFPHTPSQPTEPKLLVRPVSQELNK